MAEREFFAVMPDGSHVPVGKIGEVRTVGVIAADDEPAMSLRDSFSFDFTITVSAAQFKRLLKALKGSRKISADLRRRYSAGLRRERRAAKRAEKIKSPSASGHAEGLRMKAARPSHEDTDIITQPGVPCQGGPV